MSQPAPEPTWPDVLTRLLSGSDLTPPAARWAMGELMTGAATPAQAAAFVVALRAKGETPTEVRALVDVMLEQARPLAVPGPCLDVVGTGGDRAGTVNVSTMAALVCAAAGVPVIKHGNRAASSKAGTADVLEALGVRIDAPADRVAAGVAEVGIGFAFAPEYHPALRHVAAVRRELAVPTVFNILGPLANPARPAAALIGCADAKLAPVIAAAASAAGQYAIVVRGQDGLDEVSPAAATDVWDATGGTGGGVRTDVLDPGHFGLMGSVADLAGGTAQDNADLVSAVLAGDRSGRLDVIASTVRLNAAVALAAFDAATGGDTSPALVARITGQLPRASEALDSGAAADLLKRWSDFLR